MAKVKSELTQLVENNSNLSTKDIVKLAKKYGFKNVTTSQVYKIIYRLKSKAPTPTLPPSNGHNNGPQPQPANDKIRQLRRLIFQIGYDAAKPILDEFNYTASQLEEGR